MPRLTLLLLMCGLIMSGCAQQQAVAAPEKRESAPPADSHAKTTEADAEASLPAVPLTDDLLFQFLVSEIAGQRGMLSLAKEGYLDLARKTRDPRVVRRATEIALYSRDQEAALELSRLWIDLEPDSGRALQTLVVMLISQGQIEEAAPHLEKMLNGADLDSGFMQLPALFSKTRDTAAAYKVVKALAQKYPHLAEARYALAHAALQAGFADDATEALKQADDLKPGWEPAALLRTQLIAKSSRADALEFLKDFLGKHPQAQDVRLTYARMLVGANQFDDAHRQFAQLATELPNSAEIAMAAGLLSLQMGRFDDAETFLGRTLELGQEDGGVVRYYLGQVAEERKDYDLAANRYLSITNGEYLVGSRTRLATMLVRQGKLEEARAVLNAIEPSNDVQKVQLIQAEADLLREAKDHAAVFGLLDAAVKERPDHVDLLYDRAMAAEKLNRLDVLEEDLRKVIKLKPDYAHAYNALGYTLIEKTDRLVEASELLDKAIALAPEDPFILDSMGWLHYRRGNLDKAREFLERAWRLRQDPEIAAHLGEVLWMKGSREEASRLWQGSLQSHPKNEALIEILKKFKR
jgi:Flp pilus assembly protein TadD, contains TPR repeats